MMTILDDPTIKKPTLIGGREAPVEEPEEAEETEEQDERPAPEDRLPEIDDAAEVANDTDA